MAGMVGGKKRSSVARRTNSVRSSSSFSNTERVRDPSLVSSVEGSSVGAAPPRLTLKVTVFGARHIPDFPAGAEVFCRLSLAQQVYETKSVYRESLEWNMTWEFKVDPASVTSSRFELDLMISGIKGPSRLGRSIVPVQTLVHGSMPPTPAKRASKGAPSGVWYQLHDEEGGALRGNGRPSEIEIAFERVPDGDEPRDKSPRDVHSSRAVFTFASGLSGRSLAGKAASGGEADRGRVLFESKVEEASVASGDQAPAAEGVGAVALKVETDVNCGEADRRSASLDRKGDEASVTSSAHAPAGEGEGAVSVRGEIDANGGEADTRSASLDLKRDQTTDAISEQASTGEGEGAMAHKGEIDINSHRDDEGHSNAASSSAVGSHAHATNEADCQGDAAATAEAGQGSSEGERRAQGGFSEALTSLTRLEIAQEGAVQRTMSAGASTPTRVMSVTEKIQLFHERAANQGDMPHKPVQKYATLDSDPSVSSIRSTILQHEGMSEAAGGPGALQVDKKRGGEEGAADGTTAPQVEQERGGDEGAAGGVKDPQVQQKRGSDEGDATGVKASQKERKRSSDEGDATGVKASQKERKRSSDEGSAGGVKAPQKEQKRGGGQGVSGGVKASRMEQGSEDGSAGSVKTPEMAPKRAGEEGAGGLNESQMEQERGGGEGAAVGMKTQEMEPKWGGEEGAAGVLKVSQIEEKKGGEEVVEREEALPGHRVIIFAVNECKVAACEGDARLFCDVFVEGKGLTFTQRKSTRAMAVEEGLVQWQERLSMQIPEDCASGALVSMTVMQSDTLVKTRAVGHVRRRPLRECLQQTWMYGQYQGSSPGKQMEGALNGGGGLFELHVRTEIDPALEPAEVSVGGKEDETDRVPRRIMGMPTTPDSGGKSDTDTSVPPTPATPAALEGGPALVFSSRRKEEDEHVLQQLNEDTESECSLPRQPDLGDSVLSGLMGFGNESAWDVKGSVMAAKRAQASGRKRRSPFELLQNVWEVTDDVDTSSENNWHGPDDSTAHSAMDPSLYVSQQATNTSDRGEERILLKAAVKQPESVADWVSKALALEKLLEIRDREAVMRDRYTASLTGQISDLQHALCTLRGDDVFHKEDEGGSSSRGANGADVQDRDKPPLGYREQVRRLKERATLREKELKRERARNHQLEAMLQQETFKVSELSKAVAENADSWALLELAICQRLSDAPQGSSPSNSGSPVRMSPSAAAPIVTSTLVVQSLQQLPQSTHVATSPSDSTTSAPEQR